MQEYVNQKGAIKGSLNKSVIVMDAIKKAFMREMIEKDLPLNDICPGQLSFDNEFYPTFQGDES